MAGPAIAIAGIYSKPYSMNKFQDFKIEVSHKNFVGDKIKIDRLVNRQITVHEYKIEPSKFEGKGKCLHLQLSIGDTKHVVFTSAQGLIEAIEKVPKSGFPFITTIIKDTDRFEFS